ncbi:MAG: ATP-binding protein [Chlamydiae bacterium]|nr:ATP-binding protein [Chlamydiota bacterium]MBI3265846.1 ATP-binding protein [Chlamydiota bacterium]
MRIHRHFLHSELLKHFQNPKEVIVLEGVRQTGKTTLIKQSLEGKPSLIVTLTDETVPVIRLREAATFEDFSEILARDFHFHPRDAKPLVIDEAQKSLHLHKFILKMHSDWKETPLVLSGSAMGVFFKRSEIQKTVSPAGRVRRFVCRVFSFAEYLELKGEETLLSQIRHFNLGQTLHPTLHERLMNLFYDYLSSGGFPEAIKFGTTEKIYDYLETLLSFFWQDADRYLSELMGSNKRQYGMLFRTILESVARLTCFNSTRASLISTDSPAYRTDLPVLLDAAEEWHFLFRLPTYMESLTPQRHSSKKYLWDVGVVNHFLNVGRPISGSSSPELLAKLLESFTAQELIFALRHKERLFSWKSQVKQPKEMDFLARFPEKDVGIEVKSSSSISQKAISQLREFKKRNPKAPCFVIYLGPVMQIENIWFIPPYLLGELARWVK